MRIIKQSLGGGSGVSTADGTATSSEVLDGEVAYVNDVRIIGTMPNIGAETITPVAVSATATVEVAFWR